MTTSIPGGHPRRPRRRGLKTAALAALPLALILSACGSGPAESEDAAPEADIPAQTVNRELADQLPEDIQSKGAITVATATDYPPKNYIVGDNELVGMHIDLANAVGELLGVDIDLQATSFDAIIPGLQSKRYDMAWAGHAVNLERLEVVDFVTDSNSYDGLLVRSDFDATFASREELCGQSVAVFKGSTEAALAEDIQQTCPADNQMQLDSFPTAVDAIGALGAKRVDIVFSNGPSLQYAAGAREGEFKLIGTDLFPEYNIPEGATFWKGSPLAPVILDAMNELIANGTYEAVMDKWSLSDGALTQSELNPAASI